VKNVVEKIQSHKRGSSTFAFVINIQDTIIGTIHLVFIGFVLTSYNGRMFNVDVFLCFR